MDAACRLIGSRIAFCIARSCISQRLNCGISLSAAAGRTAVRLGSTRQNDAIAQPSRRLWSSAGTDNRVAGVCDRGGARDTYADPLGAVAQARRPCVRRAASDLTAYANYYRDVHSDAFRSPGACDGSPQHE